MKQFMLEILKFMTREIPYDLSLFVLIILLFIIIYLIGRQPSITNKMILIKKIHNNLIKRLKASLRKFVISPPFLICLSLMKKVFAVYFVVFVKNRLPQPYELSLFLIIILIIICLLVIWRIIYLLSYYYYITNQKPPINFLKFKQYKIVYLVRYLFYYKDTRIKNELYNFQLSDQLSDIPFLRKILNPFNFMDIHIRENKYFRLFLEFLVYILHNGKDIEQYKKISVESKNGKKVFRRYLYWSILPLVCFLLVFYFDIIYNNKFDLILSIIPFLFIPLIGNYIWYSLKVNSQEYRKELEKIYQWSNYKIYLWADIQKARYNEYISRIISHDYKYHYLVTHDYTHIAPNERNKIIKELQDTILPYQTILELICYRYKKVIDSRIIKKRITVIKLILHISFLIVCLYILIVNLNTFTLTSSEIDLLHNLLNNLAKDFEMVN